MLKAGKFGLEIFHMLLFSLPERTLTGTTISISCLSTLAKESSYAALFCAFLRLCCGVKLSFSSLLLLAITGSSGVKSLPGPGRPFISMSDIETIELWRPGAGGDWVDWCGWARNVVGS